MVYGIDLTVIAEYDTHHPLIRKQFTFTSMDAFHFVAQQLVIKTWWQQPKWWDPPDPEYEKKQWTETDQGTHTINSVNFPDKKPYLCLEATNVRIQPLRRTINGKRITKRTEFDKSSETFKQTIKAFEKIFSPWDSSGKFWLFCGVCVFSCFYLFGIRLLHFCLWFCFLCFCLFV